jgi:acetyl-CoA C-acetyltransferase
MGLGPVYATRKLLDKTGLSISDIGLAELNEAFAPQAMACVKELGLNMDIVNVNGSGLSLGHPLGATGAVVSIKLINEMKRRKVRYGLVSLCIGGGQGMSAIFEGQC